MTRVSIGTNIVTIYTTTSASRVFALVDGRKDAISVSCCRPSGIPSASIEQHAEGNHMITTVGATYIVDGRRNTARASCCRQGDRAPVLIGTS